MKRAEDEGDNLMAELIQGRERVARAEGELAGLRIAFQQEQGRAERAESERNAAQDATAQAMAQVTAERAAREAARGELDGLKLGLEHHHLDLSEMRCEVAAAHNRAVVAEQQVIAANERREGAEVALARARKWNFMNFLFGREGKGRGT